MVTDLNSVINKYVWNICGVQGQIQGLQDSLSYVSFEAYNEIQGKGTSKNNLKYKVAYALLQMNGINNKC